jgi:paraquat-inducible protein A
MKSVRACPDCGQLNKLPQAKAGAIVACCRCGRTLRRVHHNSLEKGLCFALAGFAFYMLLALSPLLDVSLYGRYRSNTLDTGPSVFSNQQLWFLGALVVVTTIAMPFIKLVLTLAVTIGLRLRQPPHILADCFRWAREVTKWSMLEVYLLGFLVAYTRLHALVIIHIDVAVYALIGTILACTAMDAALDSEAVWDEMERKGIITQADVEPGQPLLGCEVCHAVSRPKPHAHCHRCGAKLHARKPNSLSRTWALAIGAIIFYVPANYFPVMVITRLGQTTDHTIVDGMLEFVQAGLWPLALLVFIASIAIPMIKLLALGFMLVETHRKSATGLLLRTRLYRLVEFIGRWSMVDVFMLSVLIGLIRFGQMIEIRPGLGAPCFAAVVVLTMLAVDSLDARLMWDAANKNKSVKVAMA